MKTLHLIPLLLILHATSVFAADVATFIELPERFIIGGYSAGKWLDSAKAGKAIKPGATYRLCTLKGVKGMVTATKLAPEAEVCPDVWMAELNSVIDRKSIGISAPWNPMPRAVKMGDTKQEAYVQAVSELLAAKGIQKPLVKIKQLLRVDLDGDGEEEAIISATNYPNKEGDGAPMASSAGNYSFVALRRVLGGKVVTQILEGEFYPKKQTFNAPNIHEISGVLDLDGDGKMEIILNSAYYEGGGTTAWKVGPKKAEKVLEIECGV